MLCRAIPYEGPKPYIFLSYCHKDAAQVFPLLEQMVRDGYRVWYDEGNTPGEDWLESIAQHLNNCHVCIAIISKNAADSHNCRNEINFAVEVEKKLIAVMMEEFQMPLGMRMQLGRTHYLKRDEYPSDAMLLGKLYEAANLQSCRDIPGSLPMREVSYTAPAQIVDRCKLTLADFIQNEHSYGNSFKHESQKELSEKPAAAEKEFVSQPVNRDIPVSQKKEAEVKPPVADAPKKEILPEAEKVPEKKDAFEKASAIPVQTEKDHTPVKTEESPSEPKKPVQTMDDYETVNLNMKPPAKIFEQPKAEPVVGTALLAPKNERNVVFVDTAKEEAHTDVTKLLAPVQPAEKVSEPAVDTSYRKEIVLISVSGKHGYVLRSARTRIGRSESQCDVVIRDNSFISSHHADIIYYEGHYYLEDKDSFNGTFINDERIKPGAKVLLINPAVFRLNNEYFILITGENAERIVRDGKVFFLRNMQTQEIKLLFDDTLLLDRSHRWPGGTMGDLGISRKQHAAVHRKDNKLYLEDKACMNGVFLNIRRLQEYEKCPLESGDQITMGSTVLEVGIVTL